MMLIVLLNWSSYAHCDRSLYNTSTENLKNSEPNFTVGTVR